jgi:phage FluMu protein Com
MKTLYTALLTLVMWLFALMAFAMLAMVVFSDKSFLIPAVGILAMPALGAWYLRKKALLTSNKKNLGSGNTKISFSSEVQYRQRTLKNNKPEKDIRCPHCQALFEEMPKRKRRCPHCKEWIWPMCPPGMQHKRLTTVEQALAWKLEDAKLDSPFSYAHELAKQGEPFQDALHDAHRQKLLEYRSDGIKTVGICPTPDGCPACKKVPKKRIKITDELLNQRLPCLDCTTPLFRKEGVTGWCRCDYIPYD